MERHESLADFLGAQDPERPNAPAPAPRSTKLSRKEYAREILSSQEYRQSLMNLIVLGELPPGLHVLLHHYAYGKPTDYVEVKDTTNRLEGLTPEQLEQRAMLLAERARQLRKAQAPPVAPDDDSTGLVH
jgi:hypothetical protein